MEEEVAEGIAKKILECLHGIDLYDAYRLIDRYVVLLAMEKSRGNTAHASEILGINRTSLIEKRRKHGFLIYSQHKPKSKNPKKSYSGRRGLLGEP